MTTKKPKATQGPAVTFEMPAGELYTIFRQLHCCIASDELRVYLHGVFIEAVRAARGRSNSLRFIATDGHKLGQIERSVVSDVWTDMPVNGSTRGITVPTVAVDWFLQTVEQPDFKAQCAIKISPTRVSLEYDGLATRSKTVKGTFPDYRRVIPPKFRSVLTVDAGELSTALYSLGGEADDYLPDEVYPGLQLTIEGDRICMTMDHPLIDQVEVSCTRQKGHKQTEIGFNHRYLQQIVNQFVGPDDAARSVELHLNDPASPALIKEANQPDLFYLLMPLNPGAQRPAAAGETVDPTTHAS